MHTINSDSRTEFSHVNGSMAIWLMPISSSDSVRIESFVCHVRERKLDQTIEIYLWTNAMRSAARPEPSQTTTGTGGVSVTYSKTARIVFVPPSMTRHTTGVLECVTEKKMQINIKRTETKKSFISIEQQKRRLKKNWKRPMSHRTFRLHIVKTLESFQLEWRTIELLSCTWYKQSNWIMNIQWQTKLGKWCHVKMFKQQQKQQCSHKHFHQQFSVAINSHGCNFRLDMNFSNFLRKISSAPYFPCVPLSTSKKYACRLFNTANFDLDYDTKYEY